MNASIVVAICATVIAVLSLAVSVYEARATRRHDRISVRPFLELRVGLRQGSTAGLQLINAGLGPAAITKTVLTLDGEPLGEFSEASINILRGKLSIRPAAVTFRKTIHPLTAADGALQPGGGQRVTRQNGWPAGSWYTRH